MSSESVEFSIGSNVRLSLAPPYLKTADPMPMLRPPQLLLVGSCGRVLERRPGDHWVVKFDRGSFLMDSKYLEVVGEQSL
jgi:Protein of unknown function (DUF3148)